MKFLRRVFSPRPESWYNEELNGFLRDYLKRNEEKKSLDREEGYIRQIFKKMRQYGYTIYQENVSFLDRLPLLREILHQEYPEEHERLKSRWK